LAAAKESSICAVVYRVVGGVGKVLFRGKMVVVVVAVGADAKS
jgi:hypothetical protein